MSKFQTKTLWMGNIDPYMDETFVRGLFFGEKELTTVKVIRDKSTGFPAGYGFLEFASHSAAARVLDRFNGKPMPGNTGNAVFRLNWAQYSEATRSGTEFSIFVGDLSSDVSETQLQKAFMENFHSVQSVRIVMDPTTGVSKGYGFVRFGNEDEGREALISMQGVFVGSRPIRVSTATPKKHQAYNPLDDDLPETPTISDPIPSTYPPYYFNYPYSEYYPYSGYNYGGVASPDSETASTTTGTTPSVPNDISAPLPTVIPTVTRPTIDVNRFTRAHDIGADNSNFVTQRLGCINDESTCGNRSRYYLPVIDTTPYFGYIR